MPPTTGERRSDNRIGAADTLFDIVEGLRELEPAGVSELADHLDRPKSTVHVYLVTLVEKGYVIKDDDQYRLSLRFLELGGQTRKRLNIFEVARPEIDSLSLETGEVANFAIEEQGQRVLLYSSEPLEGVFDNSPTGQYTHMHWTALGKALLAQLSDDRVAEIVDHYGLPAATDHTIIDREALGQELDEIRERGYSVEAEERREGITAVAVPLIHGNDDEPVAAVSISGPKRRIGDDGVRESLLEALRDTVNVIELEYKHY